MSSSGDPSARPLQVGLLVDSLHQPAWIRWMLARIDGSDYAEFCIVLRNADDPNRRDKPSLRQRLSRYWRAKGNLLFLLHSRLEELRFQPAPDAMETVLVSDILDGVEEIEVYPRRTEYSDYFPEEVLDEVRRRDLDVLIRLGFRILRGGILEAARYGVWSFHHGDNRVNRGGPYGYWEVVLGWSTTGYMLQVLNADLDNGFVLERGFTSTHPVSYLHNRNAILWRSASALPRKLNELHGCGGRRFFERHREANEVPTFYSNKLFRSPTNGELLGPLARHVGRYLKRKLASYRSDEQWQLRYKLGDGIATSPWRFEELIPPSDRFWADPCVVSRDGEVWVFFEEFCYETGAGRIVALPLRSHGQRPAPTTVLERPYHLSYPFVFEHEGEWYLIPETRENRSVELYRCICFPDRWELETTLMRDVEAVDATLLQYGSRWWMFVGMRSHPIGEFSEELHLFHADSPLASSWTPHPENPVVRDVRHARPAGRILRFGDRFLRPAQDASEGYGSAISFREITRLSTSSYEERAAGRLTPDWDRRVRGVHTFSSVEDATVIDVRVRVRKGNARSTRHHRNR